MKIWLDDIRPAPDGWVWVKNYEEAIELICGPENFDEISLDHDLGDGPTGYNVVCCIEGLVGAGFWRKKIPVFHIHSANPVGRKNMQRAIESIERIANEAQ